MSTGISTGVGGGLGVAGAASSVRRAPAQRTLRRAGLAALVLGVLGVVVLLASRLGSGDGGSGVLTADRFAAKRTAFDITTTSNGELEAKNQKEIRNELETPSSIAEIIDEGKFAKKGDLLVRLNSEKIETQVTEETMAVQTATAEAATADAAFKIQESENESRLRQAKLKVTLATLALEQWQEGEVKKKDQEIKLAMEKAERDLVRLEEKYKRSSDLFEKEFLSKNDFELDYIELLEARAALEKAKLEDFTYRGYEFKKDKETKESDLLEAEAELKRVGFNSEKELATKKASLEKAKELLKMRADRLEKYQKQLTNCRIVAESEGLVVYSTSMERNRWGMGGDGPLQIGRDVYPNMLLMVLPDTSEMVASVKVQESLAGKIRPGLAATVKVDALGGRTFSGTVQSIGVLAESGGWRDPNLREYTVKVSLNDVEQGSGLKPSMRCEAQIVLGKVEDALSVPVQAVFSDSGVRFVYRTEEGRFVRVPVKLGQRSETTAEILSGLKEGEVVLLREPTPGEILSRPWDKGQLELAGYEVGEDGMPAVKREGGERPGNGSGKGPGKGPGKGRGKGAPGEAGAKPEGEAKPEADAKPEAGVAEVKPETSVAEVKDVKVEAAAVPTGVPKADPGRK